MSAVISLDLSMSMPAAVQGAVLALYNISAKVMGLLGMHLLLTHYLLPRLEVLLPLC